MAIHIHHRHLLRTRILSCPRRAICRSLLVFAFSTSSEKITPTKETTFPYIFRQCSDRRALNPGRQAHARMVVSGFNPDVYVSNCLIRMYLKCCTLEYASKVFDGMPQRDVVSWNSMISGYVGCEDMRNAEMIFESMPERDVISWNSLISGYSKNGDNWKSIELFSMMGEFGGAYDNATFAVVLKACSVLGEYGMGIQVHCLAVRTGLDNNVVTGSALVDMYAKCKNLDSSLQLFLAMPEKNWVSWGSVIAGCVLNGRIHKGFELFMEMRKEGSEVSQSIFASAFRSCAVLSNYRLGSQLHGLALKTRFGLDSVVGTAILDMYAKCDCLPDARKLFNSLPDRSLQSYNAIIVGYARSDHGFDALHLFQLLQRSGIKFDEISLSGAISACAGFEGHLEALQLHGLAIKSSFRSNIYVSNAILDLYGKCGALADACHIFDEMGRRDAVSWNSIIAAHGQNGDEENTLSLFVSMLHSGMEPDVFTYGSVLKACAGQRALNCGMGVHNRIIKSGLELDFFIGNALVDLYCKCGVMEAAEKIHSRTEEHMIVSWNSIISGFSLQKQNEDALRVFCQMLGTGAKPDKFTFSTVLDTCANLATIGLGKQIHAQIIKQDMQSDVYISSTLVDMYSKCGDMQDSKLMFDKSQNRGSVTWNVMICGYAQHGLGEEALELFENMCAGNVKPNHATFIAVLRACGHAGLVNKGLHYFHTMLSDYGLEPQLEHYCCIVDIMGRSGKISEALKLIKEMPLEANAVIWKTLLSSCKIHGNVEVAEQAAAFLLELDPQDPSAYVLLSNIYADAGMWNEVSKMRVMMRDKNIRKEPGCSWIEVKDEVHAFLVCDKRHPKVEEIYENLGVLIYEAKLAGYEPDACFVLDEEAK